MESSDEEEINEEKTLQEEIKKNLGYKKRCENQLVVWNEEKG